MNDRFDPRRNSSTCFKSICFYLWCLCTKFKIIPICKCTSELSINIGNSFQPAVLDVFSKFIKASLCSIYFLSLSIYYILICIL